MLGAGTRGEGGIGGVLEGVRGPLKRDQASRITGKGGIEILGCVFQAEACSDDFGPRVEAQWARQELDAAAQAVSEGVPRL